VIESKPAGTAKASASKPAASPKAVSAASASTHASNENDFLRVFGDQPSKLGDPCEQCNSPTERGAVCCVRCGYDRASGASMKTRVKLATKERGASGASKAATGVFSAVGGAGSGAMGLLMDPVVLVGASLLGLIGLTLAASSEKRCFRSSTAGSAYTACAAGWR
jgi:hypothetical protein